MFKFIRTLSFTYQKCRSPHTLFSYHGVNLKMLTDFHKNIFYAECKLEHRSALRQGESRSRVPTKKRTSLQLCSEKDIFNFFIRWRTGTFRTLNTRATNDDLKKNSVLRQKQNKIFIAKSGRSPTSDVSCEKTSTGILILFLRFVFLF